MPNENSLVRVTMNLTERDIANAVIIKDRLRLSNKASAVSAAISISLSLYELLEKTGGELLIFFPAKQASGARVVLPGRPA